MEPIEYVLADLLAIIWQGIDETPEVRQRFEDAIRSCAYDTDSLPEFVEMLCLRLGASRNTDGRTRIDELLNRLDSAQALDLLRENTVQIVRLVIERDG